MRETLSYNSSSLHLYFNSLCIFYVLITPRVGGTIFFIVCSFNKLIYWFTSQIAKCVIQPSEGQSLTTTFRINCSGWSSSCSRPSAYEFQYTLQNGLHGILHKGNMSSFSTILIHGISTIVTTIRFVNGTAIKQELDVLVRAAKCSFCELWAWYVWILIVYI